MKPCFCNLTSKLFGRWGMHLQLWKSILYNCSIKMCMNFNPTWTCFSCMCVCVYTCDCGCPAVLCQWICNRVQIKSKYILHLQSFGHFLQQAYMELHHRATVCDALCFVTRLQETRSPLLRKSERFLSAVELDHEPSYVHGKLLPENFSTKVFPLHQPQWLLWLNLEDEAKIALVYLCEDHQASSLHKGKRRIGTKRFSFYWFLSCCW